MNAKRVVFLHGINMNSYSGHEENIYAAGFEFAKENGFGYEVHNFSKVDGRCYGHVEVTLMRGKERTIRLEKLGASVSASSLDGVLAIWTAPRRNGKGREVVGWYRNATLHRNAVRPNGKVKQKRRFKHPNSGEKIDLSYRIEADAKDCVCLHPTLRSCDFRTLGPGLPGQFSVYYPFRHSNDEARKLRDFVLEFIEKFNAVTTRVRRFPKTPVWRGQDQERKKKIEIIAVEYVWKHFGTGPGGLGYKIISREGENIGYDLLATKEGDPDLCIEVKGRSVDNVSAEFSRNESRVVREHQDGEFGDGDYRVCIVTDALSENGKRQLHHFRWWQERGVWIDVDGSRKLDFHPSGATVAKLDAKWDVR